MASKSDLGYPTDPPQDARPGPSSGLLGPIYTCRCGRTSPLAMTNGRCGECRSSYMEGYAEGYKDGEKKANEYWNP